jgi:hypothetical protein
VCQQEQQIKQFQIDFPPINNTNRSRSTADLAGNNNNNNKPEKLKERKQSPDQQQQQHQRPKPKDETDPIKSLVRKQLISPSRTKKAASILRRSSSSSSSSNESITSSRGRQLPITANFKVVDSLQSEVQIARADNSILRQDIQVMCKTFFMSNKSK